MRWTLFLFFNKAQSILWFFVDVVLRLAIFMHPLIMGLTSFSPPLTYSVPLVNELSPWSWKNFRNIFTFKSCLGNEERYDLNFSGMKINFTDGTFYTLTSNHYCLYAQYGERINQLNPISQFVHFWQCKYFCQLCLIFPY